MQRVLVAAMHHESNSFNPIIAEEKDFKVIYGSDVFNHFRQNDSLTGVITTLLDAGLEVVPTVFARAVPNGEVDFAFYHKIKSEILRVAEEENSKKAIDAVCLSLHGSMRVKGMGEAEGDLLKALKDILPGIPFHSSLDMHTTMTKAMHENCDGFVGYKCAPHTDCTETGIHAAQMTIAALKEGIKTTSAWVRVPILIAGEQSATSTQPMIDLINELRRVEKQEGLRAASYLMGFPWADNKDSSVAVYVVTDNNQELADSEAIRLAELIWSKRHDFTFSTETYDPKTAITVAFEAVKDGKLPVYLSDSGDNPTAGSSSDCTDFLRLLIEDSRTEQLRTNIIYGGIYDPVACKACEGRVGEEIDLTFGASFDRITTKPIRAKGLVKNYYKNWARFGGLESDLALFSTGGVDIVIAEKHVGYTLPEMFSDLGVEPRDAEIVVCKLGYLTEQHEEVSKRAIMALTSGSTNEDLKNLAYELVPRPIFPLDDDFDYRAKDHLYKA